MDNILLEPIPRTYTYIRKGVTRMKFLHILTFILVVVGGLNWGLVALKFNLVTTLVGKWPTLEMLVYLLVGLSAVYQLLTHKKDCKACETKPAM